jgi:hypothetical protein
MAAVSTDPDFAALCARLYGDVVDPDALWVVAKMSPDASAVHVPGPLRARRTGSRAYSGKAVVIRKAEVPLRQLIKGKLRQHRSLSSVLNGGVNPSARGAAKPQSVVADPMNTKSAHAARKTHDAGAGLVRTAGQGIKEMAGTGQGKATLAGTAGVAGVSGYNAAAHRKADDPYMFAPTYAKRDAGDDTRARAITAGLSAVGAAAGTGGLAYAAHDAFKAKRRGQKLKLKTKALIPLEVAGLGGEIMATHILHGDTKRAKVAKSVELAGTFSKFDNDKQRAYGWASVVTVDGAPVVDRQGDFITLEDMEEAAYTYVRKSRIAGDMHRRTADDRPHQIGDVIESMVFTPEKCDAMGIPRSVAGRWWMGVQIEDPQDWETVKKGRTGFSIHGRGIRKDVSYDDVMAGRH